MVKLHGRQMGCHQVSISLNGVTRINCIGKSWFLTDKFEIIFKTI
jgi:hypothetical protein